MNKAEFDKYEYYSKSVQSPETDAGFLRDVYVEQRNKSPKTMREDFCGTFALCCEWVKLQDSFLAYGVDLDPEPLEYGKNKHLVKLNESQQQRIELFKSDVTKLCASKVDIVCALNFSYFIFKERAKLKSYLELTYKNLNDDGILVLDCFGGGQCQEANEEETEHEDENFSYFWDQDSFDPLNNHAQFYIHFQRDGETKEKKYFLMTGECGHSQR